MSLQPARWIQVYKAYSHGSPRPIIGFLLSYDHVQSILGPGIHKKMQNVAVQQEPSINDIYMGLFGSSGLCEPRRLYVCIHVYLAGQGGLVSRLIMKIIMVTMRFTEVINLLSHLDPSNLELLEMIPRTE